MKSFVLHKSLTNNKYQCCYRVLGAFYGRFSWSELSHLKCRWESELTAKALRRTSSLGILESLPCKKVIGPCNLARLPICIKSKCLGGTVTYTCPYVNECDSKLDSHGNKVKNIKLVRVWSASFLLPLRK